MIEVQPAGWLAAGATCSRSIEVDDVERGRVARVTLQLELGAGRVDCESSACDSSNSRRASACGVFDSASVSSVVPYSQLLRDDSVIFREKVPLM